VTDDDILRLAAQVLGNPLLFEDLKEDFTVHTEACDWINFAQAIEQTSRRAALEEAINAAMAKLKKLTPEMEGYSYFGSNPGVKEGDYEDVADAIRALDNREQS